MKQALPAIKETHITGFIQLGTLLYNSNYCFAVAKMQSYEQSPDV